MRQIFPWGLSERFKKAGGAIKANSDWSRQKHRIYSVEVSRKY
jgi:hypothetical protein